MKLKLSEVVAKYGNVDVDEAKFKEVFGIKIMKGQKPIKGQVYWAIQSTGAVQKEWDGISYDHARWLMGNVYDTKEDAQFELNRLRFMTLLKRHIQESERHLDDFDEYNKNFTIIYLDGELRVWSTGINVAGAISARERYTLEEFITQYPGDTKLYLFGVK